MTLTREPQMLWNEGAMFRKALVASLLAASAMTLCVATPAQAGKTDRARAAIAAAEAKVETAESVGAGAELPGEAAEARARLATAKEDLSRGHPTPAFEDAVQASALADTAIGEMQRRKDRSVAAARAAQRDEAAAAQDKVAAAQQAEREGVAAAQDQATAAQQQAAEANARATEANSRAEAAQQAAATSEAAAADARDAAAIAATPAQVDTTVTTRQGAHTTHHSTRAHVVRHKNATTDSSVTATTTVTRP